MLFHFLLLERVIIPEKYELRVIHVHHDGSQLGAVYSLYFESRWEDKVAINLVRTSSRLSKRSVPVHEHLSRILALEAVLEIGSTIKPFYGNEPLEILIGGDSTCSTHLMNPSMPKEK